jgi:2-dehydro-3-deoxyphosphogluconate aldolase/(4S)-4-hydroxy-2-oxoglutarate aldolase
MPTGGVTPSNLENYLRVKTVVAVGGTWIAKKEDLAGGRWEEIVAKCRVAREWVARVRGRGPEQK